MTTLTKDKGAARAVEDVRDGAAPRVIELRGGFYAPSAERRRLESAGEPRRLDQRRVYDMRELRIMRAAQADDPNVIIAGYAALFDTFTDAFLDWWGFREVIRLGAFTKTLAEAADVRDLRDHIPNMIVARTAAETLRAWEDREGLRYEADADTRISYVGDLVLSIERGDITQNSFAFKPVKSRWTFNDGEEPDIREILEVKLYDVSQVTYPAYEDTTLWLERGSIGQIEAAAGGGSAHARQLLEHLKPDARVHDITNHEPGANTHSDEPEPQDGNHSDEPLIPSHSTEPADGHSGDSKRNPAANRRRVALMRRGKRRGGGMADDQSGASAEVR